jgi:hypothetical protein
LVLPSLKLSQTSKGKPAVANTTSIDWQAVNMPSQWLSTVLLFTQRKKQPNYTLVSEYRDSSSVDGEKGELLPQDRVSFSVSSDDRIPPVVKPPSKILHRMSLGLNAVLLCAVVALIVTAWPELVLKRDKFNNGLLKRTSRPCMSLFSQSQIHISDS